MAEITSRHGTDVPADPIETDAKADTLARGWQDELGPPLPPPWLRHEKAAPAPSQHDKIIRTLALFSDGTGNSSAKAEKTNVWRMFQAIDQSSPAQLALYDDGVGSETNKYRAAITGAVGLGLKRNVIDLYKFVCRNYIDETTKIYAFGFSRGAFTIRVLIGLISHEGLVNYTSEEELDKRASQAYTRFRIACFKPHPTSPVRVFRWLRSRFSGPRERPARTGIKIEFLGLWDTVDAYGMPIAELKPVVSWFYPLNFTDLKLSKHVKRACHALSLDDERTTFHPIVWDQSSAEDQRRISQVWFAGVHSNLGGGYPEDQLSLVSLDWMMQHAQDAGLQLQPECVKRISSEKSAFARIYDSRQGVAAFYRYSPRSVPQATNKAGALLPIIHGSVIARMTRGSDAYVPNALPPDFLVLAPDGELLPMKGYPDATAQRAIDTAAPPKPQILDSESAPERALALKRAMQELSAPDRMSMAPVMDAIWWRRVAWVFSAALASLLVLYPWLGASVHRAVDRGAATNTGSWTFGLDVARDAIVAWDRGLSGFFSRLTGTFSDSIPAIAKPWTRAIGDYPVEFFIIAILFIVSQKKGKWLRGQLRDYCRLAWHARLREPFRQSLRLLEKQKIARRVLVILLIDAAYLASAFIDRSADVRAQLAPFMLALNVWLAVRLLIYWRFVRRISDSRKPIEAAYVGQTIARIFRTSRFMQALSACFRTRLLPIGFGLAIAYAVLSISKWALGLMV